MLREVKMKALFLLDGKFSDIICLIPVFSSLKSSGCDISLIYNNDRNQESFKSFLEDYKLFDNVIPFSKKEERTGDKFIQWMSHKNFDIVIANKDLFRWALPYIRCEIRYIKEENEQHYMDLAFNLLGDLIKKEEKQVRCPLKKIKKRIFDKSKFKDTKLLVISPTFTKSASGHQHHWGTQNYITFINALPYDWKPILLDRDDGISTCNQINFLTHRRCLNLAGCLTLSEMAFVIKESEAMVGNMFEVSHLSASLNKKSIILCSPASNLNKRPLSKEVVIFNAEAPKNIQTNSQKDLISLNSKCISLLKPEMVIEILQKNIKNEEVLIAN